MPPRKKNEKTKQERATQMEVWCLFESSDHDDLYERDNDGTFLVAVFAKKDEALAEMERCFRAVEVNDGDTVDRTNMKIGLSKWLTVFDSRTGEAGQVHDVDWCWHVERREVR